MVTAVTSPLKSNYPTFASPEIKDDGAIALAIARSVGAKEEMEYIFSFVFLKKALTQVLIYSHICNKMIQLCAWLNKMNKCI